MYKQITKQYNNVLVVKVIGVQLIIEIFIHITHVEF